MKLSGRVRLEPAESLTDQTGAAFDWLDRVRASLLEPALGPGDKIVAVRGTARGTYESVDNPGNYRRDCEAGFASGDLPTIMLRLLRQDDRLDSPARAMLARTGLFVTVDRVALHDRLGVFRDLLRDGFLTTGARIARAGGDPADPDALWGLLASPERTAGQLAALRTEGVLHHFDKWTPTRFWVEFTPDPFHLDPARVARFRAL